jgi:hypothetical protein
MKNEEKPKGFMHTKQDLKTALSVWRRNKEEKPKGFMDTKQDLKTSLSVMKKEEKLKGL